MHIVFFLFHASNSITMLKMWDHIKIV